jgi:hypothetical protein
MAKKTMTGAERELWGEEGGFRNGSLRVPSKDSHGDGLTVWCCNTVVDVLRRG